MYWDDRKKAAFSGESAESNAWVELASSISLNSRLIEDEKACLPTLPPTSRPAVRSWIKQAKAAIRSAEEQIAFAADHYAGPGERTTAEALEIILAAIRRTTQAADPRRPVI